MALKDMKSDLSKFRMPKSTPLESKERVDVTTDGEAFNIPNITFFGRDKD